MAAKYKNIRTLNTSFRLRRAGGIPVGQDLPSYSLLTR